MAFSLPLKHSAFPTTGGQRYSGKRLGQHFVNQATLTGSQCQLPWPLPLHLTDTSRYFPPRTDAKPSSSTSTLAIQNSAKRHCEALLARKARVNNYPRHDHTYETRGIKRLPR